MGILYGTEWIDDCLTRNEHRIHLNPLGIRFKIVKFASNVRFGIKVVQSAHAQAIWGHL